MTSTSTRSDLDQRLSRGDLSLLAGCVTMLADSAQQLELLLQLDDNLRRTVLIRAELNQLDPFIAEFDTLKGFLISAKGLLTRAAIRRTWRGCVPLG